MFGEGVSANDLSYRIYPAHETQGLIFAIEDFMKEARAENFSIYDVSLIPSKSTNTKDNEVLAVFFFKRPPKAP